MAELEVPIMCTLSPNNMADRLTEFEALFSRDLTGLEREPLRLRLVLDGMQNLAERNASPRVVARGWTG